MNKKIIAVFCVVILMVSIFSACKKKNQYTIKINGKEQPVVTENGEIVTNSEGKVAVYVTNASGENVTESGGNPKIEYVNPPSVIINPNKTMVYDIFKMNIQDGWAPVEDNSGKLAKNETEMKCYIKGEYSATESEDLTLDMLVDQILESNRGIIDAINSGAGAEQGVDYTKAEMANEKTTFLGNEAYHLSFRIYNSKGDVVHYAENIFFRTSGNKIYCVSYVCEDGVGYDANFNFSDWANENITVRASEAKK